MVALYIVATPIGNLEDVTLRALRVLKEVDYILCEDTRMTRRLLSRYDIDTPMLSYHAHSAAARHEQILELLREGKNLALVSDAGTPAISDPGVRLLGEVKARLGDEVEVRSVPGPSALTSALSISGVPASSFLFLGFLPHKKGREKYLAEALASEHPAVLYESPHRLIKLLSSIEKHAPERRLVLARELTKVHEEVLEGNAQTLLETLEAHPQKRKGEFVVIITPRSAGEVTPS